ASTLASLYERRELKQDDPYILHPGKFILGQTLERVALPFSDEECYAARVEGKSSLARCGLIVHFTAPTVHAGFSGPITLEIINLGAFPIALHLGMPICQLIFEPVKGPIQETITQFHGQVTPEGLK
ncbi:MAG TPA: dCTP deaminase, partial [Thermosulfurimonas dismutans]|nr:dCTP deaminase [Thermosulfurimonas dismutans]